MRQVEIVSRLKLENVEWKEFFIGGDEGLFDIKATNSGIDKNKLLENDGHIPYITRSNINNGIDMFVGTRQRKGFDLDSGNVITIGLDTQTVFYQEKEFYTGQNIQVINNENLNKEVSLFLIPLLKTQMEKFSWGSMGATLTRLRRTKILLPVDSQDKPNWQFMEDYIKQEQKKQAQKLIDYYEHKLIQSGAELLGLDKVEWGNFYVGDLFDFRKKQTKGLNHLEEVKNGGVNYLGATNRNNGVMAYVTSNENMEYEGNCIAFIRNGEGSMGYSVYKKESFIATQDISVGYNENLDEYIGQFITTIADKVRGKYNFGYKRNLKRLKKEILQLPIDEKGNPNYEYMRIFMQQLEKENLSKVLDYIHIYIYIYRLAISLENTYYNLGSINIQWKSFWLEDIVDIYSGVRLTKANQSFGRRPFIGSTDGNNGVTAFISNENNSLDSNVLGVNYNGSVVDNFYHPYECLFSDDVKRFHFKEKDGRNKYCYLFLKQSILKQKQKYAYGYKFNASRMKRQKIMLPVNSNGGIDYEFMKSYMIIQEIKEIYKVIDYYNEINN